MVLPLSTGKTKTSTKAKAKTSTSKSSGLGGWIQAGVKAGTKTTTSSKTATTGGQVAPGTLPPGAQVFDLATLGASVPSSLTPGQVSYSPISAATVTPNTVNLAQLTAPSPVIAQPVGPDIDTQVAQAAKARQEVLRQKLAALDKNYSAARGQIHSGYLAVNQLLGTASANYQQGMAPVMADQNAANAAAAGAGSARSQGIAQILASQGLTSQGADEAAMAAAGDQATTAQSGALGAQGLAASNATNSSFFAGLPALAAMGEAGGIGQSALLQQLASTNTTNSSLDAGMAQEASLRQADLTYRQALAQSNTQAERDMALEQYRQKAAAITGNVAIQNSTASANADREMTAATTNASGGLTAATTNASNTNSMRSDLLNYAANQQTLAENKRQFDLQWDQTKADAVAKLSASGAKPADIAAFNSAANNLQSSWGQLVQNNGVARLANPFKVDPKAAPVAMIGPDGKLVQDPAVLDAWLKQPQNSVSDVMTYASAMLGSGRMKAYELEPIIAKLADLQYASTSGSTVVTASPDAKASGALANQKASQDQLNSIKAAIRTQIESLAYGGLKNTQALAAADGSVISATALYQQGWDSQIAGIIAQLPTGSNLANSVTPPAVTTKTASPGAATTGKVVGNAKPVNPLTTTGGTGGWDYGAAYGEATSQRSATPTKTAPKKTTKKAPAKAPAKKTSVIPSTLGREKK